MPQVSLTSIWQSLKQLSLGVIWLSLSFFSTFSLVQAETIVTGNGSLVTASVKDHTVPSAPILIAPPDGSSVITSRPTFSWYAASDDVGVSYYQLFIDGVVFLNNLPANSAETNSYKLVKTESDNSLAVTLKTSLTDGQHTWKIVVFDEVGNSNTSAVWSFKIDTQAPNFVLTQLGDLVTHISAQDSSTWPITVLIINDNPAQLSATVETDSQVQVTVTWAGVVKQTLTSLSLSPGVWQTILGIVPRDTEVRLDFLITDSSGLITILENVPFIVQSFNLPWLGGGLSPTPTLLPGEPTLTPIPASVLTPAPTPASTVITGFLNWNWPGGQTPTKTTLPWIQELVLTLTLYLPAKIAQPIQLAVTTPPAQQPIWWIMVIIGFYLIGLILAWLWWWWRWRQTWLQAGLRSWWQVLGWFKPKRLGILLNFEVNKAGQIIGLPVPLKMAKISVMARISGDRTPVVIETIFSDQNGQFALPTWPSPKISSTSAQYSLIVTTQDERGIQILEYCQPIANWPEPFTPYTYWHHQYYGGWLSLRHSLAFPALVVLTQTKEKMYLTQPTRLDNLGIKLTLWSQLDEKWWLKMVVFSLLISSIWGGWLNWLGVINLMAVGLYRTYLKTQLRNWQILLPHNTQAETWHILTSKDAPDQAWWAQTEPQNIYNHELKFISQIPKNISQIRVSSISANSKIPRSPETWEVDLTDQAYRPMPTFNIECKSQKLIN